MRISLLSLSVLLMAVSVSFAQRRPTDQRTSPPRFIELADKPGRGQAQSLFRERLAFRQGTELRSKRVDRDRLGFTHESFQQYHNGLEVEGGTYKVHSKDNRVWFMSGSFIDVRDLSTLPAIPGSVAMMQALRHVGAKHYAWRDGGAMPSPELVIVESRGSKGKVHLAYKMDIYATDPLYRANVFVDAHTGQVVREDHRIHHTDVTVDGVSLYNGTVQMTADQNGSQYRLRQTSSGNGIQTFDMNNGTNYNNATDITDNSLPFNSNATGVQAHWGAEQTHNYFLNDHGRNSFDGNGATINSYISYSSNYVNAFWDGQRMTYGDGDGVNYGPLVSLDIVGHEITHGVTEYAANLIYSYESGALNESFSDIFGEAIEHFALNGNNDWQMGTDIGIGGSGAIRSMDNPNAFNDPDTYQGTYWYTGSGDNGGVHINSGVQNKWFYILTEGESGTNDLGNSYAVTGIGMASAAAIAYRNLTVYLSASSNYFDARTGAIQSAIDLFGAGSPEEIATTDAWYAVGVGGAYGTLSYCTSRGNNSSYEWIANVTVGSFSNNSGAAGYTDFTGQTVTVDEGQSYSVSLTPGYRSTVYNEYWKIWIDYNADGDFGDPGELAYTSGGLFPNTVTGTINIPTGTDGVTTRMRVSMKWNASQTECETFSYGEVEDYTITIGSTCVEELYYADADGDGYGDPATEVETCDPPAGYILVGGDCDDGDAAINPGATEVCDGIDNNCDGNIDEGVLSTFYADTDVDGFGDPNNTIQACSAPPGYVADNTDCNDAEATINPIATEICDGIDNNCDGNVDEGLLSTFYADTDGDGFGDAGNTIQSCSPPPGYVADNTDCDDTSSAVNPGAVEVCDGIDNNCDGNIDEGLTPVTYYADSDGDGYGDPGVSLTTCDGAPGGYVADNTDCNDSDDSVNPGAVEVCDGIDNNCDGSIDEGLLATYYEDADGDGFGNPGSSLEACSAPPGYVTDNTDCNDADLAINPGAVEICDGVDNNCDGQIDEGIATATYYADSDGDGYGDPNTSMTTCGGPPPNYVADNTDCDDSDGAVNSGATEVCDGIDNNCDGIIDPDCETCGVLVDFNNFESGWGIWNDGGSDCRRSSRDANYAIGTYCVRLRDNTSTSVMTTDNLNLASYSSVTVDFSYYPRSMDNSNEDFWLQVSTNGGSSYTTVATWSRNSEFQNNQRYFESVEIVAGFTSNTRLRFRCDASGNSDWVYIDEVSITGCSSSSFAPSLARTESPLTSQDENVGKDDSEASIVQMQRPGPAIYPNPVRQTLNVENLIVGEGGAAMQVTDLSGKVVLREELGGSPQPQKLQIDVSNWQNGFYLLQITTSEGKLNRKFIVQH